MKGIEVVRFFEGVLDKLNVIGLFILKFVGLFRKIFIGYVMGFFVCGKCFF